MNTKMTVYESTMAIEKRIGVVSFNLIKKQKELKEIEKEYDQLHAQLAAMQNVKPDVVETTQEK